MSSMNELRRLAGLPEAHEAPDADGAKAGEWNIIISKGAYRSLWSIFVQNPQGGGSGGDTAQSIKVAIKYGFKNVKADKAWIIIKEWDPEKEDYVVKKSYLADKPVKESIENEFDSSDLGEQRCLAGITSPFSDRVLALPEAKTKKSTAAPHPGAQYLGDLHKDFDDLVKAIETGEASKGGLFASALARLQADLDRIETDWKAKPSVPTKQPPAASYDPAFVEKFQGNMHVEGDWTDLTRWIVTMKAALSANSNGEDDDSYNNFSVKQVGKWLAAWRKHDTKFEVMPAREYSVAVYVHADLAVLEKMEADAKAVVADEVSIETTGKNGRTPVLRLWWD